MNSSARNLIDPQAELYRNYQALRDFLMTQVGWTTQGTINQATGLSGVTVRQVCNAYPCLAIGSTEGYKLVRYANQVEVQHAVSTLMNRSISMLTRAQKLSSTLTV